jgi:Tar ligand binding domain homologue
VALVFALAVGGCGGDDDSGGVSKAEFIKKADSACASFRKKSAQLEAEANRIPQNDTARLATILEELADAAEETFAEFEQLDVPAGDEKVIDRYLSANRDQIDAIRRTADAFQAGDIETASKLIVSGRQAGNDTREIAQKYGFEVCGSETD